MLDHRAANVAQAVADAARPAQRFTAAVAGERADTALSEQDQTTVIYAGVAAPYAVYAVAVLRAVLDRATPPLDVPFARPSQVLTDLEQWVPLITVPAHILGDQHAEDQNKQLRQAHEELVRAAIDAAVSDTAGTYDDRTAAAARPDGSVDLVPDVPAALHAYAAAAVWVLNLMLDTDADDM